MQILVIDDDAIVRNLIGKMLEDSGFEILYAGNGVEGLKMVESNPEIELVITDLIMPEKEGIETIRELKQNRPEIKIIAISGGGRVNADNYLHLATLLGANAILTKPFTKSELIEVRKE